MSSPSDHSQRNADARIRQTAANVAAAGPEDEQPFSTGRAIAVSALLSLPFWAAFAGILYVML